jgi:hypothetical protein
MNSKWDERLILNPLLNYYGIPFFQISITTHLQVKLIFNMKFEINNIKVEIRNSNSDSDKILINVIIHQNFIFYQNLSCYF